MYNQLNLYLGYNHNIEQLTIDGEACKQSIIFEGLCKLLSIDFKKLADEMKRYYSKSDSISAEAISDILMHWHPALNTKPSVEKFLDIYEKYKKEPDIYNIRREVQSFYGEILYIQAYIALSDVINVLCVSEVFKLFAENLIGHDRTEELTQSNYFFNSKKYNIPEASQRQSDNIKVIHDFVSTLQYSEMEDTFILSDHIEYCTTVLYHLLDKNYSIKKCKNCGKFFVAFQRSDSKYCDNPSPQDRHRTCKQYGTQRLWYDEIKKDDALSLQRKVLQAKQKMASRYRDIPGYVKGYEDFKKESKEWKNNYEKRLVTKEEFIEWLKIQKEKKY